MDKKIYAIIPIKYNSERVPGKNFRLMNGKPLFYYIINTLLKCNYIDKIFINIDNELTEENVNKFFLEEVNNKLIELYYRPKELFGGNVPTNKLFIDMIEKMNLNADYYFQTHTTNPLLRLETINNAIDEFLLKENDYDSLYSVKEWKTRLYDSNSYAVNHNPNELLPTQDLEPLYEENSCMYMFTKETLIKKQHRIGYKPMMYVMNDIESQDIDIETDFLVTESLMADLYLNLGKVVIVTGVCGGIGYATAMKFKRNGWIVIGIDIKSDDNIKNSINELHLINITNENEIKEFVKMIEKRYKRVDCIVNNAALQICKPIHESDSNDWNAIMNTNVKPSFLFAKYFRDLLIENKGSIVNVSSVHAVATSENIALYASSKGCLSALTRAMALEYGKVGVRVNSILPGAVDTSMLRAGLMRDNFEGDGNDLNVQERLENLGRKQCLGRVGEAGEIGELILFLADGSKSGYIVGQSIVIDGGATIKLSTE